ncbi:MAG: hypothetical protein CVU91_07730 [Firmicutes bacterium HGW-Firmicutes-16]|nr:MAG: hypothetical protein CVU91_07730 [Firmicutes bacterium HGW-Firmicutes-16]
MNLVKERVQHRQYGVGVVKKQTDTTIDVKFGTEIGTKRFIYPSVFLTYLVLCSPDSQQIMTDELQEIRDKIAEAHKCSLEETKRIQTEARTNLVLQKRAAAKKKATATKNAKALALKLAAEEE